MAVNDNTKITFPKNIHLSHDFKPLSELSECFFGLVLIISQLDSQSKFQMFTLISGHHIGGLRRLPNMAAPN